MQRLRGYERRNDITARLLAGVNYYALPVQHSAGQAFTAELNLTAFRPYGPYLFDTEFNSLLQGIIHALPARNSLHEHDVKGRFPLTRLENIDYLGLWCWPRSLRQPRMPFVTLSVEQD